MISKNANLVLYVSVLQAGSLCKLVIVTYFIDKVIDYANQKVQRHDDLIKALLVG